MNFSQLNTYIKAALPRKTLSIAKGKMTKNIDELLKYCFGSKALVINNLQLENEDETSKTILVSGTTTYLKLNDVPVKASFKVDAAEKVQLEMVFTLPSAWKFSDCFPELPKVMDHGVPVPYFTKEVKVAQAVAIDRFSFENPVLVVTTQVGQKTINGVAAELKWGINFVGKLKPKGMLLAIENVFKHQQTLDVWGTVRLPLKNEKTTKLKSKYPGITKPQTFPWDKAGDFDKSIPGILLKASLGLRYDVKDSVHFAAKSLFIYSPINSKWMFTDTNPAFVPVQAYAGSLIVENQGGEPVEMDMVSPIEVGKDILTLYANFHGLSIQNLAHMAGMTNDGSAHPAAVLPTSFSQKIETLAQLELVNANLSVNYFTHFYQNPNQLILNHLGFTIGFPTLDWHVWEDHIIVKDIYCVFDFDYPLHKKDESWEWEMPGASVGILAGLTLEGVPFDVYGDLYKSDRSDYAFYAEMKEAQTIPLKAIMQKYAKGVPTPSDLTINLFRLGMVAGKSYSFGMSMAEQPNSWIIDLGNGKKLTVQDVSLLISYVKDVGNPPSAYLDGELSGSITFGKNNRLQFSLSAALHKDVDGIGWQFTGSAFKNQAISIAELIEDLESLFGIEGTVPKPLEDIQLQDISISFNTHTKDFVFSFETKFPLDENKTKLLDATISIAITHNDNKYSRKFSGIVKVGDLEFDLIFQQAQDADTLFLAAYENRSGKEESIKTLVGFLTDDQAILSAADGITFQLKDALLVIDKTQSGTKVLFGLDISGGLDMTKLPLVGKMFPKNAAIRMTFQPLLTNKDFDGTELGKIKPLVPSGGYQLPDKANERLAFNMNFQVSEEVFKLNFPITANEVKKQAAPPADPTKNPAVPAKSTSVPPPSSSANIKWFKLQKQLGPVNFGRVGIQYEQSELYFLLDASLTAAGLTISLDGLYACSKLQPIHPEFGLHGLGIDFKKGALEIGGSFLHNTIKKDGNTYDTYDGMAIIRTGKFALSAIGSYSYYQGHPSLFIYAFVDVPLGGPVFFNVTGLAAGFGYNRRLLVPSIDQVQNFPLVAEAVSGVPGSTNNLSTEIAKLHDYIPPAVGEYFMAVGLRFTSFKILDSFVLLSVSFGHHFELDVLGLSTLVVPPPEAGATTEPLAEVQIALKAVFDPEKGFLKVRAGLTNASFILSRNCHLTGGLAFYTWFKDSPAEGASAGDFVLTLGGYHPLFKRPSYYPTVAPLGFNWQLSNQLAIKGHFYFALVPSAVMVGGHLGATWTSGNLQAWFNIGADFIISWKPYFYDASMQLDMGVHYTYHCFGTHHISVDVGANLHIWGPEFSGKAHVHLWIVTFDVAFGAHSKQEPAALNWKQFREGFLPDTSKWKSVHVTRGLIKQLGTKNDPLYVVNPAEFRMETNSAIPVTQSTNVSGEENLMGVGIGPMKIKTNGIVSKQEITIKMDGVDKTDDFTFSQIKKNVPAALWGNKFRPTANDAPLIKGACTGFTITAKKAVPSSVSKDVDSKKLLEEEEFFNNKKPVAMGQIVDLKEQWLKSAKDQRAVAKQIESKYGARNSFLKKLGIQQTYYPNKDFVDDLLVTKA